MIRTTCRDQDGLSRLMPDETIQHCLDSLMDYGSGLVYAGKNGAALKLGVNICRAIDRLCELDEATYGPLTIKTGPEYDQGQRCRDCALLGRTANGWAGSGRCGADGSLKYGATGACDKFVPKAKAV